MVKSFRRGQTIVESLLVLPIFLLFVFGLLQMGQIGVALVTASYAAGSIARHRAQEGSSKSEGKVRLDNLVFAGMTSVAVSETDAPGPIQAMKDVKITACVGVSPLPFVGPFVFAAIGDHSAGADTCDDTTGASIGPLYFVPHGELGANYFVVRGSALARRNYQP